MAKLLKIGKVWYSDIAVPKGRHAITKRVTYKRVRKALSTDKNIALHKLSDLIRLQDARKHGHTPTDLSWEAFRDQYLKERSAQARPTYTITKRAVAEIEDFTTPQKLTQITTDLACRLYAHWKNTGVGLYMRNRMAQGIKTMMHTAEGRGLVQKQDWGVLKLDKEPQGRLLWYTAEELRRVLKAAKGVYKTVAMLCARAGLRRAEAYWLEWTDVDFERGKIHIAPKPEWTPKDHERRWIPMSNDLRGYLKKLPRHGRFVLEAHGERMDLNSLSHMFSRLLRSIGLKGSIHTLRHTFGSHLASAGVSIYIIKDLMGHKEVEQTSKYAHLSPDATAGAIHKLPPI
jgi:site-specific recombinase XerD